MRLRPAFLFDPAEVAKLLADLPHLRDAMPDPAHEGEESVGFAAMRKSERQLYRVLSNAHYEHLEALLRSVDFCIGRGFTQPSILRTRARGAFASALSEVRVAEHLIRRGFDVEGLDLRKGSDPVPELVARRKNVCFAVEVYAPVEWEGLNELMDDLSSRIKNLDLAADFRYEATVRQLEQFDSAHRLLTIHPGEIARALGMRRRIEIVAPLLDEVEERLLSGELHIHITRDEVDLNIRVQVEVGPVVKSRAPSPARFGVISPPGFSGYAPEGMFDRLVRRRVRSKAAAGQAPGCGVASISLLAVDMVRTELLRELVHPLYRSKFEDTLRDRFESGLLGYDLIAFCESRPLSGELQLHFLVSEDGLESEVAEAIFGGQMTR